MPDARATRDLRESGLADAIAPLLLDGTSFARHKGVGERLLIRHRLLTILLLGALVSALSVGALARLLTVSTAHRVERARDEVLEEVERLVREPAALREAAPGGVVGMRAGIQRGAEPRELPPSWVSAVARALREHRGQSGARWSAIERGSSTFVVATLAKDADTTAWAALEVRPLPQIEAWKPTIWLLALATIVLVATTVRAVVVMQRGANALGASLNALASDLDAPIPRPALRELSDVADGIARLAKNLAEAKREEARLGGELAQNERLAALGRVAAGVAHEVRNPLASIKLRLDLAAASTRLPDPVLHAISHATSEIERLDRLVADLLVVAGRSTGPQRPLSLAALAKARVETLAPWANERQVALRVSGDAKVHAHADSLARAIDNLLRNAVEASPPGAEVSLEIDTQADRAQLAVCDSGNGVPAERASELFEPFFTTKPDGTGLGLPLARSIARAHGGDVRYTRRAERTRFELELRT
jgi:signal transduction histidine kinase